MNTLQMETTENDIDTIGMILDLEREGKKFILCPLQAHFGYNYKYVLILKTEKESIFICYITSPSKSMPAGHHLSFHTWIFLASLKKRSLFFSPENFRISYFTKDVA